MAVQPQYLAYILEQLEGARARAAAAHVRRRGAVQRRAVLRAHRRRHGVLQDRRHATAPNTTRATCRVSCRPRTGRWGRWVITRCPPTSSKTPRRWSSWARKSVAVALASRRQPNPRREETAPRDEGRKKRQRSRQTPRGPTRVSPRRAPARCGPDPPAIRPAPSRSTPAHIGARRPRRRFLSAMAASSPPRSAGIENTRRCGAYSLPSSRCQAVRSSRSRMITISGGVEVLRRALRAGSRGRAGND